MNRFIRYFTPRGAYYRNPFTAPFRRWKWRKKHDDALRGRASSGHLDKHERNSIFQQRKKLPK